MKLYRELNSTNVEIYRIEGASERTLCFFMILDTQRKSSLKDFPYLIGIEEEKDFSRENLIKACILSDHELSQDIAEEIGYIITRLTEYPGQLSCHISIEYQMVNENIMKKMEDERDFLFCFFDDLLFKENSLFSLLNIKEEAFNNLSQKLHDRNSIPDKN